MSFNNLEAALNALRIQEEIAVEVNLRDINLSDRLQVLARNLKRPEHKAMKRELLEIADQLRGKRKPIEQLKLF